MGNTRLHYVDFTISSALTQPAVGSPVDSAGFKLAAIICPSDIGSAATMTFDLSRGIAGTSAEDPRTPPTAAADYYDAKQRDGATEQVTLTLSAGDEIALDADDFAYALHWPRWLRPTLNTAPSSVSPTFTAVFIEA